MNSLSLHQCFTKLLVLELTDSSDYSAEDSNNSDVVSAADDAPEAFAEKEVAQDPPSQA